MPLEIEVKLKVPDHTAVRQRLMAFNAQWVGKVRETNVFFDRGNGVLRQADSGLRVRLKSSEGDWAQEALLTFKGPVMVDALGSREAFDLQVMPREQVVPFLKALGFEQVLLFEKDRESWEMEGCKVELDTLPEFGGFVEIEGPTEERVRAVQARLGLGEVQRERASYSKMVGEYLRGNSIGEAALRFEAE